MKNKPVRISLSTALIYWVISVVWILLSDRILAMLVNNVRLISEIQTYKGWAFVTVTAVLLYILLKKELRHWESESKDRQLAEEALIASEENYRSLFENSIDAILLTSPDGEILSANTAACRVFGWTEEELKSMGRAGVADPEDLRHKAALEERRRTGKFRGELTLVRKDGTRFPAELSSSVLKDRSGNERTSMVIRDITERKHAEELLMEKEEYLRALVENASDAIAVLTKDLENVYRSPSRKRLLGYENDELVGPFDTVHPDDRVPAQSALKELIRTPGSRATVDLRLRHKDGSWRNIEATAVNLLDNNSVRGIVINYRDITSRKRAEEEMRLWVAAIQSAANAVVITDREANIQFVNAAFTTLTGYGVDEVIGRNPRILKSGRQPESFYKQLWGTISAGIPWHGQLVNSRKDGSLYDEEMTITPVKDDGLNVTHYIAIKEDVSERKRLQEQLIQSQKMESIGILAAGIAHDFNNVLGIILGNSSLIERTRGADERIIKSAHAITQAADRGASLVRQMLTFARKSEVSFSLVFLNDCVRELQKLFYETFPRTMTLVCQLDDNLPLVTADSTQIHQVLLNLSVNARDAMRGSGVLVISTDTASGEEVRSKFNGAAAETYVRLSVSDNGEGMDEETRLHVFEPFFTTKGPGKGTGLGLSVVFGIVENHGGFIDVASEPERGTTFTIYIPTGDTKDGEGHAKTETVSETAAGDETVLVVEDEEMLKELAISILSSSGYKVVTADDGEQAVEIYERQWKGIDIVFSDYGLPKLSGLEVMKRMKTINPDVRFVAATGFLVPEEREELLEAGAMAIILKPYKQAEVLDGIRRVLDA